MSNNARLYIEIAPSNGLLFSNADKNDVCFKTSYSNQGLLFGIANSALPTMAIKSSNIAIYGQLGIGTTSNQESFEVRQGNALFESNVYVLQSIGIGNSSPSEALDITRSNAKIGSNLYVINAATIGQVGSNPSESLDIGSNLKVGSNVYAMNAIGVMTSNPTEALDVMSNIKVRNNIFITNAVAIGGSNPQAALDVQSNAIVRSNINIYRTLVVGTSNSASETVDIVGNQKVTGNSYVLTNLHVGGSNPTEALDVRFNAKVRSNLYVQNAVSVGGLSNPLQAVDIQGNVRTVGSIFVHSNIAVGSPSSNATERIDVTGNVKVSSNVYVMSRLGIGLSNPTESLQVSGNVLASNNIYSFGSLGMGTVFPTEKADIYGNLKVSSNTYIFGSLGISKSNPTEKIDVVGNIRATGNVFAQNIGLGAISISEQMDIQSNLKVRSNAYIMRSLGVATSNPTEAADIVGNVKVNSNLYVLSNLGVNNSNPTESVDVTGNIKASSNIYAMNLLGVATSNPQEVLDVNGNLKARSNVYVLSNLSVNNSNPTERLDVTGNVKASSNIYAMNLLGVATSNPQEVLDVNGNLKARSNVYILSNLGVNNSNPTERLDVTGNVKASSNIYAMNLLGVATSNPQEVLDVNGNLKARSNVFVLSNLSVNNSNPTERLDVTGNVKASSNIYAMNLLGVATSNPQEVLDVNGNLKARSNVYVLSNLSVNNSNPTERLDVTGNVKASSNIYAMNLLGVATSNPTETLDVNGNLKARSNVYVLSNLGVNNSNPTERIDVTGNVKASSNIYAMNLLGVATSNPTETVDVNGNLKARSNVYVLSNLGVNNSNPTERVDVIGNVKASSNIYAMNLLGVATSNPQEVLDVNGDLKARSNVFVLSKLGINNSNPTERVDVTGNVKASSNIYAMNLLGVATSNPTEAIDVIGNIKVSSNLFVLGNVGLNTSNPLYNLHVNGSIYAAGYCNLLTDSFTSASTSNAPTANALKQTKDILDSTSNVTHSTSNILFTAINNQSNSSIAQSLTLTATSNDFYTSSNILFSSLSNTSNMSYTMSNTLFVRTSNTSNMAFFASNAGAFGSNLAVTSSNFLYPGLSNTSNNIFVAHSNTSNMAFFASNAGAFGSNLAVTSSNFLYPGLSNTSNNIFVAHSNTSNMALFASNTAVAASNRAFIWSINGSNVFPTSLSNLAIGTNAPAAQFHVVGKTFADTQVLVTSNDSSNAPGFAFLGDSNTGFMHAAAGSIAVVSQGTERVRFDNAGNVGIGVSNPAYNLDVRGSGLQLLFGAQGSNPAVLYLNTTGVGNTSSELRFVNNGNFIACTDLSNGGAFRSGYATLGGGHNIVYASAGHNFFGATRIWSNNLLVDNSVGIGTTSVAFGAQLHVESASSAATLRISSGSNIGVIGAARAANDFFTGSLPGDFALRNSTGCNIIIGRGTGSTAPTMTLDSNANVGIGTTTPGYRLDVNGTMRVSSQLSVNGGASGVNILTDNVGDYISKVYAAQAANGDRYGLGEYTAGAMRLFTSGFFSGATIRLSSATNGVQNGSAAFNDWVTVLGTNGNVGIGTTSPSVKLTLAGADTSTTGPHINFITAADAFPQLQILPWAHNNVNFGFDTAWNGTNWISSTNGGNFLLNKTANILSFQFASNVAANSTISSWNSGLSLNTGGNVGIATNTPSFRLDVNGDLNFRGTLRSNGVPFTTSMWSNNSSNVFVPIGSNVAIGLSNPAYGLDINVTTLHRYGNGNNSWAWNQILFGFQNTATFMHAINTRHNSFGGIGNSIDFLLWDSNVSSNVIGTTNAMSITAAGIGIFNSNPSFALDITGDINFRGTLRSNGVPFSGTGGTSGQWTSSSSNVFIGAGSNLGIRTSTPAFPLDVNGSMRVSGQLSVTGGASGVNIVNDSPGDFISKIYTAQASTGDRYGLGQYSSGTIRLFTSGFFSGATVRISSATNGDQTANGAFNDWVTVLGTNGNVGIGTTSPGFRLDVNGTARFANGSSAGSLIVSGGVGGQPGSDIKVYGGGLVGATASLSLSSYDPSTNNPTCRIAAIDNGNFSADLDFLTKPSGALTNSLTSRMRLLANGNLGIGTTSPSFTLDVNGNTRLNNVVIGDAGFGGAFACFSHSNTFNTSSYGVIQQNTGNLFLNCATGQNINFRINNVDQMVLNSTGFGIGTNNPSQKLHVIGAILASGDITAFSDKRLKSNITPITDGLEKVLQLNGYTFNTTDDDKRHTGLLAQEVMEVLPEVVQQQNDGFYSVAYGNMAGLFVEAFKSMHKQMTEKITQLEDKIATMQAQLHAHGISSL